MIATRRSESGLPPSRGVSLKVGHSMRRRWFASISGMSSRRFTMMKFYASDASGHDLAQRLERRFRLGPMGIVGVGLHGTYNAAAVDDETRGHRQAPRRIAVADGEVVTETDIDLPEIVRQREGKPEGFGDGGLLVP